MHGKWQVVNPEKNLLIFLKKKFSCSNRSVKRLIDEGYCLVNDRIERFSTRSLKIHDRVVVKPKEFSKFEQPKILYEDEYLMIVDKPINLSVEEKSIKKIFNPIELVHRLDKRTSGLLILAKSVQVREKLKRLFSEKKIEKHYIAFLQGRMKSNNGKIENYLSKKSSWDGQSLYHSSKKGNYSLTYWKLVKKFKDRSIVLAEIITGKTHQLRVHFSEMGYPIIGDHQYNPQCRIFSPRLLLHAFHLFFIHPITNKKIDVVSQLPNAFSKHVHMSHLIELFRKEHEKKRRDECDKEKDQEKVLKSDIM